MKSLSLWRGALLVVVSAGLFSFSTAQETTGEPEAKPKQTFRLPYYFGKLGVDDEQRKELININQSYEEKIAPLRQQIKALLKERDDAMEASLTEGQKLRLQELRAEAKSRESKKKSDSDE